MQPVIADIDLDHVAVAVERQADAWPRYAADLPSEWVGGGATVGFASAQVRYANGMKVEVLEPHLVGHNDFLRRFLDRNGPGPHHLTYKVPDLATVLPVVEEAGYRPVGVDLSSPSWKEAFLHPKDAPGVVVQLAESAGDGDWGSPVPAWFPPPRTTAPATLVHVAHAVADLDDGLALFAGLLAGRTVGDGSHAGVRWVDLAWPGPGRVRLVAPQGDAGGGDADRLREWLGGRAGRIHHVAFACPDPAGVPGARPLGHDRFEVAPEHNLGVRLLVAGDAAGFAAHPIG